MAEERRDDVEISAYATFYVTVAGATDATDAMEKAIAAYRKATRRPYWMGEGEGILRCVVPSALHAQAVKVLSPGTIEEFMGPDGRPARGRR